MDTVNLANPDLYINRELSLLEFNRRVIAQARDPDTPLLERVRFACIAASNLDEFFEVRVAGLKQQVDFGSTQRGPDNMGPAEQLRLIAARCHELVAEHYLVLNDELIPSLKAQGIRLLQPADCNTRQQRWLKRYFNQELAPVLSPVGLDPAHPFPKVMNKSLNFIVDLEGKDAFGRNTGRAIIQAPRTLPRVIQLPENVAQGPWDFILLTSVIETYVADLFPGMAVEGCYQFRVTRNSDLFVDEEEVDDLLRALEGELPGRRYGDAVRLEIDDEVPEDLEDFLVRQFELTGEDVYRNDGPVNLARLMALADMVERPDLTFPGFTPTVPGRLRTADDIFEAVRKGDILLHHPFQSFVPVVEFLRQAARDPKVLSVRQTLYRTGPDSAIVGALVEAAKAGKEVTVVIELKARFDEEANIELANHLQEAGAHVVYGVVGHKTHAKMILVIRREGRRLRRYVHLGTGNYHSRTARLYTDYGMLSADEAIGEDVQKIFQQLMTLGKAGRLKKVLQSPFTLHKSMLEFIEREAANARAGKPARIRAKMNSLIEPQVVQALYRASQAGVRIDLVVRGVCALRPGIKGISDTIHVRSIVGRFLEHTRVYCFENAGDPEVWLSSADWMGRNFFRRVETCFPMEDKRLKARVIKEVFDHYLADNSQAWVLQGDGSYKRVQPGNARRRAAQERLLSDLAELNQPAV